VEGAILQRDRLKLGQNRLTKPALFGAMLNEDEKKKAGGRENDNGQGDANFQESDQRLTET